MTSSFGWSLLSVAVATTEAHFLSLWSPRRNTAYWTDSMGRRNPRRAPGLFSAREGPNLGG